MMDKDDETRALEVYFDAARRATPEPSAALLTRVADQAQSLQPAPAPLPRGAGGGLPGWRMALSMIGGWPTAAALSAAMLAGVWLGVSPPAPIGSLSAYYLDSASSFRSLDGAPWMDDLMEDADG